MGTTSLDMKGRTAKVLLLGVLASALGQEDCPQGQKLHPVFDNCDECQPGDSDPACAPPLSCPFGQKLNPVFDNCDDCLPGDSDPNCPVAPELCSDGSPVHPEYGCDKCFDSINEIEDAIFTKGDLRQAFNDCNPERPCSFYRSQGYACAPSWTCHNNTIITDGKGLIDVRQADDDVCSEVAGTLDVSDQKCDNLEDVCCQRPNFRAEPCTEVRPPKFNEDEKWQQCGRSQVKISLSGLPDDVDKTSAQPGEFPHMCIVYRDQKGSRSYLGGASLIAPNKVLTVAHKFLRKDEDISGDPSQFFVRCGEHNVKAREEILPHQESQVLKVHFHPDYVKERVRNNLVILQTTENFIYDQHIGPVCLPGVNQDFSGETECWSSGWGADDFTAQGRFSDVLKKVQMPVVDSPSCQERLKAHKRLAKNPRFTIHDSWVCVGGEPGVDTCTGDGGSPHVCKDNGGNFVQVGAVSFGIGCGDPVPSVYSSVSHAMCWVDWLMSCVPPSNTNVDYTKNEFEEGNTDIGDYMYDFVGDLRGDSEVENLVPSVNELDPSVCRQWNRDHEVLRNMCQVEYFEIDQRSSGK